MSDYRRLTMQEALQQHQGGGLAARELNSALLQAAKVENPDLGAYTHLFDHDPGLEYGVLAGFSAAIKANIAGCGWPNHCGSQLLEHYRSPFDSTAIARLKQAGCGFVGINSMDEFGMGSSGENTRLTQAVNPWNHDRTAGGSSSGTAAAVAAGLAWFGLGSDTGGSVRLPAHFCGIVGLKPTWGRVSRYGLVAFASSLDTIGVLARGVSDAHLVFQVLAGSDPLDATSKRSHYDQTPLRKRLSLKGLRVGVPEELKGLDLERGVRQDHEESCRQLQDQGASLLPVRGIDFAGTVPVYTVINCAEASSNLQRYDGSLYGVRKEGKTYEEVSRNTRTEGFGAEVKRRILLGAHVLSAGFRQRYYLRARSARRELRLAFRDIFSRVDILALPTAPGAAFPLGSRLNDPVRMYGTDSLTVAANLAGLPALTLPTNLDHEGLPLSLQLMGPEDSEKDLLEIGLVLEKAFKFRQRKAAPWQKNG